MSSPQEVHDEELPLVDAAAEVEGVGENASTWTVTSISVDDATSAHVNDTDSAAMAAAASNGNGRCPILSLLHPILFSAEARYPWPSTIVIVT
mmetsp:Transcript_31517/g.76221  ORF Transcript_31517/g.76221 Transcript_31517/m.76221 type:complete len:93 (-) Transcript_31517:35-313(-)